jgi:aryl-alcohol dehydrogenase-like predicted oxidoreductase
MDCNVSVAQMPKTVTSSRLALGTAQFGLNYGVANRNGQVPEDIVASILDSAAIAGLDTLDTAIAYGESESLLGRIGVDPWQIVTKLPPLPNGFSGDVRDWVMVAVSGSLQRLGRDRLRGVLLHRPADLLGEHGRQLYDALVELKDKGRVDKIGVSIYQPDELDALFSAMAFDIVQAPLSILDRRLVESGWLERLCELQVEVHVRSIFLQGLLLMPSAERPDKFRRWQPLWELWDRWIATNGLTALEACVRFAMSHSGISRVVVGVDSESQLREILAATDGQLPEIPDELRSADVALLNPASWQAL